MAATFQYHQLMEIIQHLSPETTETLNQYIRENLLPLAKEEQAKCATGRLHLWLRAEPNYVSKRYRPAHEDDYLWSFCQQIYPSAALAQIYFALGGHGIDWHRDAAFAMPEARIVNLGKVCLETQLENKEIISLELTGGEVLRFNSKLRHRSIVRAEDRIGIGLWQDKIPMNDPRNWE